MKKKTSRKKRKYLLKSAGHQPDWWLVGTVVVLALFGLVMIANASAVEADRDFADKYYYFRQQAQWVGLGLIAFGIASVFPYQRLKKITPILLFGALLSLVLVLLPKLGFLRFGARRWLTIGGINFQPSELTKLAFIVYLAAFLENKRNVLPLLIIAGLIVVLVMLQPDLGTTLIILTSGAVVYFVAGAPVVHLLVGGAIGFFGGLGLIFTSPYRKERFLTFLNPLRDPLGASYHIHQILIALGSGGLFGLGIGQSRQKYEYLPAVTTDSIFAVIAEELGFVGASVLILIFIFLIWRGLKIAQQTSGQFGQLLATGITAWVGIQALINLAAMVALVPLTGVPLPFVSYGGSSLLLSLTAMGILVNISKQTI